MRTGTLVEKCGYWMGLSIGEAGFMEKLWMKCCLSTGRAVFMEKSQVLLGLSIGRAGFMEKSRMKCCLSIGRAGLVEKSDCEGIGAAQSRRSEERIAGRGRQGWKGRGGKGGKDGKGKEGWALKMNRK